jgi:hypothetical protein
MSATSLHAIAQGLRGTVTGRSVLAPVRAIVFMTAP